MPVRPARGGSFEGFRTGLEGEAANLSDEVLQAAYAAGESGRQFGWRAGWTTFYWAWWIAFSPFAGLILTAVMGTLIPAAGENTPLDALRNAMIIGALPFTMVRGLMCLALAKALYRDRVREKIAVAAEPAE